MLDLTPYAGKAIAIDVRTFKVLEVGNDPDIVFERVKKKGYDMQYINIMYVEEPDVVVFL